MGKFSNPFAETMVEKIHVGGKEVDSKIAVCVKDDDGEFQSVGFLSTGYNLIPNQRAKDVGDDIMSRSGHEWKELKTLWDGKRFAQYFITREPITEIQTVRQNEEGGRPIHLGLMIRNSYDGTGAFGQEIYACDYTCMNQFISRNRFGYFVIYHDDKNEFMIDDAVKNVSIGVQKLIDVAPKFQELSQTSLGSEHIVEAHAKTRIPESMWGKVLARLAVEEASMFGLYSAMTYIASHKLKGFNQITVGNSITDHFLG